MPTYISFGCVKLPKQESNGDSEQWNNKHYVQVPFTAIAQSVLWHRSYKILVCMSKFINHVKKAYLSSLRVTNVSPEHILSDYI